MRRFLRRLLLLALLPALVFGALFGYRLVHVMRELDSSPLKRIYSDSRLDSLQQIGHKIILIGGSNLRFGIDRHLLQRETNQQVVSFGYARTDGLENMLHLADRVYRDGDVILLSLEYGERTKGSSGDLLDFYLYQDYLSILRYVSKTLLSSEEDNTFYSQEEEMERQAVYAGFDESFYLYRLDSTRANFRKLHLYDARGTVLTYDEADKGILQKYLRKPGKSIFGVHPALCLQVLSQHNRDSVRLGLLDTLPIPYITRQSDYLYDTAFIFDYPYHVNARGREMRTRRLAGDIRSAGLR